MSAEFVHHEELADATDKVMNYVDLAVQKYMRESERRIRAELQAFRERHDVEMAQVHAELGSIRTELGGIQEMLRWIAQRLPPEPIGPPPAQFLTFPDPERT